MHNNDTIHLLRECDAGVKMAISSIDDVQDKISQASLSGLLVSSMKDHEKIGKEIQNLLSKYESKEKDPPSAAKGMSWMKTAIKLSMDESDATIADLITDGCNMGIKSLSRYLNQYSDADKTAEKICGEIIRIEEQLALDLRPYL